MSDQWPPGGEDAELERLANHYIDGTELDLAGLIHDEAVGPVALVSAFGADSVVLLHKVLSLAPETDVIFLDTLKHFAETEAYVETLCTALNIQNFKALKPDPDLIKEEDPDGDLWSRDPNMCCMLRKTFVLQDALRGYRAWMTGRKRYQGGMRAILPFIERDGDQLKINPLIHETPESLAAYIETHDLPQHPLVAKGYPSIGCAPCTKPMKPGDDHRSGRWQGVDKAECGIHLGPDGRFVRSGPGH